MERTKFCMMACPPETCDCGLYDEWVDYPCDVEPPYDDEVKEVDDPTHSVTTTEQPPTANTNG
jgi:hypothetical protein